MLRSILYDPNSGELQVGAGELIEPWQQSATSVLWLDIGEEASAKEIELLHKFGIHDLAIQDALRDRHPPKMEAFDDFLFILLRGLDAATKNIDFGVIQLSLFVGKRYFVTRHAKASSSANWLFDTVQSKPELMAQPSQLAVSLANRLQRRYIEILLDLEPRLDSVEDEMFEKPDDQQLADLTRYKSKLRQLSRIASYHEHVVTQIRKDQSGLIANELEHELTDLYEQTERTLSLADLYYHVAADLTDSYLGLSSHRLNAVMQILTIITVIFVPLTFLAGIYGMNFVNIPELASPNGYFYVIGVMLVVGICQIFYFKRKGWM